MRFAWLAVFLVGCVHVPSIRSAYPTTTQAPPSTVDEAISAAPQAVDDSTYRELPNQDTAPLLRLTIAPFSGILMSEYDAANYPATDAAADRLRIQAATLEWQLARTERRDAEVERALQDRVDLLATQSARRRRWMYVFLGFGFAAVVGTTAAIVH